MNCPHKQTAAIIIIFFLEYLNDYTHIQITEFL